MAAKVAKPSLLLTPSAPSSSTTKLITSTPQAVAVPPADEVVTPGDRLCEASYEMGVGTYRLGDHIYAAVVGRKRLIHHEEKRPVIHSCRVNHQPTMCTKCATISEQARVEVVQESPPSLVPIVGDIVICKVNKVNVRFAMVDIVCVGETLVKESFSGTIRQRDVRAFDIDSVEIYKSFRPGDMVKARVLSLGDSRSFFLSTADNELGVLLAYSSASNELMTPISWQQMQCPVTLVKEFRKVAKVTSSAEQQPTTATTVT